MQDLKVNRIVFNLMRFCSSTFVISVFLKIFRSGYRIIVIIIGVVVMI